MPDEPRPYDLPRSPALRALHARYIGDDPERQADYAEAVEEAREEQRVHEAIELALGRLREAEGDSNCEAAHQEADRAILRFLRDIGHGDVADAWWSANRKRRFWYS